MKNRPEPVNLGRRLPTRGGVLATISFKRWDGSNATQVWSAVRVSSSKHEADKQGNSPQHVLRFVPAIVREAAKVVEQW